MPPNRWEYTYQVHCKEATSQNIHLTVIFAIKLKGGRSFPFVIIKEHLYIDDMISTCPLQISISNTNTLSRKLNTRYINLLHLFFRIGKMCISKLFH